MAASQAKAAVTQTGSLLWSGDLSGLATDASVTPVVNSAAGGVGFWWQDFSVTYSGATFSGSPAHGGGIWPGPYNFNEMNVNTGTSNYLFSYQGGSITMATPSPESYLGFLVQSPYVVFGTWQPTSEFNVTLYNGSALLGEITSAQLTSAASAHGSAWINIDVANGGKYTSAVFSLNASTDIATVLDISYGTTSESLSAAPLPALAGTIPGFAAAVLGMFGLRRSRGRRA